MILQISAKAGLNVDKVLEQIIERIPAPLSNPEELKKQPLKAFLFDAKFVPNRGVQCLIKIMSGNLNT